MAILLNRLTSLPIGTLTFLINIPLLIASWIYLGKEKTIKTLKTVAIMTVILDGLVTPYFPVYSGDKMVSCLFGGVLMGISLAVVFMRGSTTGWRRYRREAFTEVPPAHADRKGCHGYGSRDHSPVHGGVPEY